MPYKKKVNTDVDKEQEATARSKAVQRALELNALGMSNAAIARDVGVHAATIRTWFRINGIPPKKAPNSREAIAEAKEKDEMQEQLEENLNMATASAITESKLEASLEEDKVLADIAEAQSSPADKYQHYIAAAGIKLLRDGIRGLKPPKTVRELSELDQLIRRNLGLNAKTGGGTSKLSIDISILNNGAADKGNGTIKSMKNQIIDAEAADEFENE